MSSPIADGDALLHQLLAKSVAEYMVDAVEGHCARVDYLRREEAEAVCRTIRASSPNVAAWVLGKANDDSDRGTLYCTADTAIEHRNRKEGRLCLFVPPGLVDATISSLGNSFASIDGRELYSRAEQHLLELLSPDARALVDAIRRELRGAAQVSQSARLDITLRAWTHQHEGTLDLLGAELWRVGLIADVGPDLKLRLRKNRDCAAKLVRPARLSASYRDRIASLGVSAETNRALEAFFARRPLHDIRAWSRELAADTALTFDRWVFPDEVKSDLAAVRVTPFTDNGTLLKRSKFLPLEAPGDPLRALCGERQTLTISWVTEPPKAMNVHGWRVSLVPASDDDVDEMEQTLGLPVRMVKGSVRSHSLKLNLAKEDIPTFAVCVRVCAVDAAGAEVMGAVEQAIEDRSEEFYLVSEEDDQARRTAARRKSTATIGLGRILIVQESKRASLTLSQPSWVESASSVFFSMQADDDRKTRIHVGTSPLLLALQRQTLQEPQTGGRYLLTSDEVMAATLEQVVAEPLTELRDGAWADFWRTRNAFFGRLRAAAPQDAIEATEWKPDLIAAVLRYAQAYSALLTAAASGDPGMLREALSVDTLRIRIGSGGEEIALVVLPTHPLRALWCASHAALLGTWEDELLRRPAPQRRLALDARLLQDLRPINVPAFAFDAHQEGQAFAFFQNLHFFYGVALPAHVRDPHRRFLDIAEVVGAEAGDTALGDLRPETLTPHLRDFRSVHPYAYPLAVTLINPDNGAFFAQAVEPLFQRDKPADDADVMAPDTPAFSITAYVAEEAGVTLDGLLRLSKPVERVTRRFTDHLQPAVACTVRPLDELRVSGAADAHLAVLTDITEPRIRAYAEAVDGPGSLSLYGLIARFAATMHQADGALAWRHRIVAAQPGKSDEHPAEPRLGAVLINLHRVLLQASGRLLAPLGSELHTPCLEVQIDTDTAVVLDRVHEHADWVIIMDRFFGVDYYDSPRHNALAERAHKYLVDYTPEFVDGLGHRSIVTTAWRDEVEAILRRAVVELGFSALEDSAGRLLHHLKTVSGRLALDALGHDTTGISAVSMAVVTAWLQQKHRLEQGFLVPVDAHRELFWPGAKGRIQEGERRCELALFNLRRNIVEVTFIEVKWRRGPLTDIADLGQDMALQMKASSAAMESRFFNPLRVDGALQRAHLASVLSFYSERARRYGLLSAEAAETARGHLRQLERESLTFRSRYEGFIVSLESRPRKPLDLDDETTITLLTLIDFEAAVAAIPALPPPSPSDSSAPSPSRSSISGANANAAPQISKMSATVEPSTSVGAARLAPSDQQAGETGTTVDHEVPGATAEIAVVLGTANGREVRWQPKVQGSPHLFITGIPGQGKSWATTRLLIELSRQGVPALVFDFHGQMGDADGPLVRAAHPQVVDASLGLPFSPFECSNDAGQSDWGATATAVADIFEYVCNLGAMQRDVLFTTIRDAYHTLGFGVEAPLKVRRSYPTLQDVLRSLERAEGERKTQNVVARCRPLLEMDLFRPPADSHSDLISAARQGMIIDLHRLQSETLQRAAGAFILRKLYADMFGWGQASRPRLALVLDEAHRLARDVTLPKIMKEGRKFGVLVVVASQGLRDFHQDVLGNAGTKVAFRANYPEARKVAGFFQAAPGQDLAAILANLRVGTALVQTPEMHAVLQVRMAPLAEAE